MEQFSLDVTVPTDTIAIIFNGVYNQVVNSDLIYNGVIIMRRRKMSRRRSRRSFRRSASRTHRKNVMSGRSPIMRGGIRL